jgi:hypothetical protein
MTLPVPTWRSVTLLTALAVDIELNSDERRGPHELHEAGLPAGGVAWSVDAVGELSGGLRNLFFAARGSAGSGPSLLDERSPWPSKLPTRSLTAS